MDLSFGQQIVAASLGAVVVTVIATPFEVIKVRLQVQLDSNSYVHQPYRLSLPQSDTHRCCCIHPGCHKSGFTSSPFSAEKLCRPKPYPKLSTMDTLFKIVRNDGLTSLWKGLPVAALISIPQTVLYFTTYDRVLTRLKKNINPNLFPFASMMSGAFARVFTVTMVSPVELFRTKLQSHRSLRYPDLVQMIIKEVRHVGLKVLWRGSIPTLWRDVPFSGIYWFIYEHMNGQYGGPDNFTKSFACGALAGMIAAFVVTPFDVAKTLLQASIGSKTDKGTPIPSTVRLMHQLFVNGGVRALFTGSLARVIKIAPSCALMIGSYQYWKNYFMLRNQAELVAVTHGQLQEGDRRSTTSTPVSWESV